MTRQTRTHICLVGHRGAIAWYQKDIIKGDAFANDLTLHLAIITKLGGFVKRRRLKTPRKEVKNDFN